MKILIIGAGPAGLACAWELSKNKSCEIEIWEKEGKAGGMSRSIKNQNYLFDIGGHRFFSKILEVNKLWKELLGKEFIKRLRKSQIFYVNKYFDYPINFQDVMKKFGWKNNLEFLITFLRAKINKREEISFEDWAINNFGKKLYESYFKEFTQKVWGLPCKQISKDWANQRVKGLSFGSVIKKILGMKKSTQVKSMTENFYYPKYGAGQMYEEMKKSLTKKGVKLKFKTWPKLINNNQVINNKNEKVKFDYLISSVPITEMVKLFKDKKSKKVKMALSKLKFRSFIMLQLVLDENLKNKNTWIYVQEPSVDVGKVQFWHNWSKKMSKKNNSLGVEYYCQEGDEIWKMSKTDLVKKAKEELVKIRLIKKSTKVISSKVIKVPFAYPIYEIGYKKNLDVIRKYLEKEKRIISIGRSGLFKYNNMDHSIYTGFLAARNILGNRKYDLWEVNQDENYHESE
jgi:protoporphyrinogen oxidase